MALAAFTRRVTCIDAQQLTSAPAEFVVELAVCFAPALVLDTPVETALLSNLRSWLVDRSGGGGRHVDDAEGFFDHDRVVFADRAGRLVDLIFPHVGYFRVKRRHGAFRFLPIL